MLLSLYSNRAITNCFGRWEISRSRVFDSPESRHKLSPIITSKKKQTNNKKNVVYLATIYYHCNNSINYILLARGHPQPVFFRLILSELGYFFIQKWTLPGTIQRTQRKPILSGRNSELTLSSWLVCKMLLSSSTGTLLKMISSGICIP